MLPTSTQIPCEYKGIRDFQSCLCVLELMDSSGNVMRLFPLIIQISMLDADALVHKCRLGTSRAYICKQRLVIFIELGLTTD